VAVPDKAPEVNKEPAAPPDDERQEAIEEIKRHGGVPTDGPDGKVYSVRFDGRSTTDDDIATLPPLQEIRMVSIADCDVTDASLHYLSGLPNLKQLFLHRTLVTRAGADKFQQDWPTVYVNYIERPLPDLTKAFVSTGIALAIGLVGVGMIALTLVKRAALSGRLFIRGMSLGVLLAGFSFVMIVGVWRKFLFDP
jgi:hypothetical protein